MDFSETKLRDIPSAARGLPSVEYDKLVIPMVCEWGPMQEAHEVIDFDDFVTIFGPGKTFLANYYSAALLQIWFRARKPAIIIRVAHMTGGAPTTAAKSSHTAQTGVTAPSVGSVTGSVAMPFALVNGDTLICNVDGVGNQTATISATAALRESTGVETFALVDLQDLTVKIDRGTVQTVVFNTAEFADIANATAEEVAAVIAAELIGCSVTVTGAGTKITITSDTKGTDSYVEVTGGTANGVLAFNVAEVQGTGNVGDVSAVTIAELKTIGEAAWTNGGGVTVSDAAGYLMVSAVTAGAAGSVAFDAASTAEAKVGLDTATHSGSDGLAVNTLKLAGKYYGTMGDHITYDIASASGGEAEKFDCYLYLYGTLYKAIRDATMDATDTNYIENLLNDKQELVVVDDQSAVGTTLQRRPANTTGQALSGGNDGLTALTDADFYGAETYSTGLYALDAMDAQGDIVMCPDRATTAMQVAAKLFVADHMSGKLHFIPDPPAASSKIAIVAHRASLTSTDFFSGMPWPRVKIANPSKDVYGETVDVLTVPPSVTIATRMAMNSENYTEAVMHQPGNRLHGALPGVVGLEGDGKHEVLKKSVQRYVSGYHINPILQGRRNGENVVWLNDVQVLNSGATSLWTSIGASRHVALVRKKVEQYMEDRRTQNNTQDARQDDKDAIEAYLGGEAAKGVFATKNKSRAFYVNTDPAGKGINNAVEQKAQRYHVVIGLAYAEPARMIDVGFTRDERGVISYIEGQKALS